MFWNKEYEMTTIERLNILFAINKVPNNFLGLFINAAIALSMSSPNRSRSFNCCNVKEKNAVSEEDINADPHTNNTIINKSTHTTILPCIGRNISCMSGNWIAKSNNAKGLLMSKILCLN